MNSTNEIEKALQQKISAECRVIVDKFTADLIKLQKKYGGTMFYDFKKSKSSDENFHVQSEINKY